MAFQNLCDIKTVKIEQGGAIDLIRIKITGEHHVEQNLCQIIKHKIDIYSRNHEYMNFNPVLIGGKL